MIGTLGVTLYLQRQLAEDALSGLAFAGAFERAQRVHFECPGLLPDGGVASEGQAPSDAGARAL